MKETDYFTYFREALEHCTREHGSRIKLANEVGVTPQTITDIVKGRTEGSEVVRRRIALYFGFKGIDDFIEFGRSLSHSPAPDSDSDVEPNGEGRASEVPVEFIRNEVIKMLEGIDDKLKMLHVFAYVAKITNASYDETLERERAKATESVILRIAGGEEIR